ncbi:MAG TPA: MOSC domain-containing protein [Herpetosiphonaceae bacterium]
MVTNGHIFSLQRSNGGVPKLPIREATLTELGLEGDRQRDTRYHGGPERALCLFSLEEILLLQSEGHPIYPGSIGENVTIAGLDWTTIKIGDCLALGEDVLIQITSHAVPCSNIKASFEDGKFSRISHKTHPGESRLYARILRTGELRVGQAVRVVPQPAVEQVTG